MKKNVISALVLLLLPVAVLAANDLTFNAATNITVGSNTLEMSSGGTVDEMVVGASDVTFTLSSGSSFTLRSNARRELNNSLGLNFVCSSTYSELVVSGNSSGSTLTVSPGDVCAGTATSGGTVGGGGGSASLSNMPVTTSGLVTATSAAGGKTTITTSENTKVSVILPAGSVSDSTLVSIIPKNKDTVISSKPIPSGRSMVGGYVYDYTAIAGVKPVSSFSKTLTLTFTYKDDQISGLDELSLRVFYWKESSAQWVALPTTISAITNTVTATTDHFTYFSILAVKPGEEVDDIEEEVVEEEIVEIPVASEATVNDGDVIRNPNAVSLAQFDVYIVKIVGDKKFKRLVLSPHVFASYGHLIWEDIKDISQAEMDEYTTSDLVRAIDDTMVYKLTASGDTGKKQWLDMTADGFISEGYDADSIYVINDTDRDAYAMGLAITSSNVSAAVDKNATIIIKTSNLRVRNKPSLDGVILDVVYEGEVYETVDEQNGWYKINTKGNMTGWCFGGETGEYAIRQ